MLKVIFMLILKWISELKMSIRMEFDNIYQINEVKLTNDKHCNSIVKKHFYNIDILRFIFAIAIFLHHYCNKYRFGAFGESFNYLMINTSSNSIAVQYFFIIAGFFLAYTFNEKISVMDFIKKKIIRLWPLVAFAVFLYFLANIFGIIDNFKFYENILALFFLENIGITLEWGNVKHDWFISVLFFISIFYFYIFKYFKKTSYNFFIPILVLLSYTFLVHATNGAINGHLKTFNNILTLGVIQGLAGMGLGYLIHELYKYIISQPFVNSIKSISFYTIIESYLLGFIIYASVFHNIPFNNKIILIIAFSILLLTFILKRGIISRLLDNKFSTILGNYVFALYMTHGFLWNVFYHFWIKDNKEICIAHPYVSIFVCFIICFLFAVFTYHCVEVPAGNFLKKKLFPINA